MLGFSEAHYIVLYFPFLSQLKIKQMKDAMDWMLVSPQNLHIEALSPSEMVFGGGAFGR